MLARYEYTLGGSNKFWELKYDPSTKGCIATWGKIGTSGTSTNYPSIEVAYKKAREKLAKGYVVVSTFEDITTVESPYKKTDESALKIDPKPRKERKPRVKRISPKIAEKTTSSACFMNELRLASEEYRKRKDIAD